jgi:hypothetical protein
MGLKGNRLWVMGQLDSINSTCTAPPGIGPGAAAAAMAAAAAAAAACAAAAAADRPCCCCCCESLL